MILVTILEKVLDTIILTTGYTQIIDKPICFTDNLSSCIDLTFTCYHSIIVGSGTEKPLCSSFYHDIIYEKINFKINTFKDYLGLQEC